MIDKLSFLKGGSEGGSVSAEEERLMQLFQNRAGLKKAYADLKDEFHLLRDRLKQQEGATIRVQEQLDALGDLLADPAHRIRRARVLSAARLVEDLPSAARPDSPRISPASRKRARRRVTRPNARPTRNMRLADVEERLQAAAAEADAAARAALAAAQDELSRA